MTVWSRARTAAMLAGALLPPSLSTASGGELAARPTVEASAGWRVGEPTPIAVRNGAAVFRAPLLDATTEVLVVASSLARSPLSFPVRLEARPVDAPASPDRAADGPTRTPALAPFDGATPTPLPARIPPAERTFHILAHDGDVADPGNYRAVKGKLRAVGRRVQVYVADEDEGAVAPPLLADLIATFDDHILPTAARSIGLAEDVDGDGRFTILLSSWLARLGGGRNAVDGYVRVTDLVPSYPAPFSNRCDMMYLSTALRPGPYMRTVIAHEYTHAVVFTRKSLHNGSGEFAPLEEEGWLDEALAHLCEDLHGFARSNLDYRISAFLSRPERYRLVVDDYYAADLFRSHGNRGGTYLFLRWCADQYGPDLLPTLIGSNLRGMANLEAATGRRFADLYRRWTVALYLSGLDPTGRAADSGFPGYRSIDLRAPLGAWTLAGPRYDRVVSGGKGDAWEAAGTSCHYTIVQGGGGGGGAVEIRVDAPADAQLQVTAVILPRATPRLSMTAQSYVDRDGDVFLRASARSTPGKRPIRLSSLAWEPLTPAPDARRSGAFPGRLDSEVLAAAFDETAPDDDHVLRSRPIRLTGVDGDGGPMVVKLVGVDDQGRRAAAWAEVQQRRAGPIDHPDHPLAGNQ